MADPSPPKPGAASAEGDAGSVPAAEVRAVFGVERADALEPLVHNPANAVTAGIWRVRAGGVAGGAAGGRTAILKVVSRGLEPGAEHWAATEDPAHWNYWRREVDALVADLPGRYRPHGVEGPRVLHVAERSADEVALWTADLGPDPVWWPPTLHEAVARGLGRAQGAVALEEREGSAPPRPPWLSRGYLRAYSEARTLVADPYGDDRLWSHPLARSWRPHRVALGRLHAERHRFYDWVESCPRTIAHLDLWPSNLRRSPVDGVPVLVDWSFCGDGALGEDIGNLIPDSVNDGHLPAEVLVELDRLCRDAYLAGLADVGWDGDEREVHLAIAASAVKYHWLAPLVLANLEGADVEGGSGLVGAYGGGTEPAEAQFERRAVVLDMLCRWADEARTLARALGRA